jgi:GR25 family glycosyltransferase involved in LPS biosynthesis
MADQCAFYCVSYNAPERANTMRERFAKQGLVLNVHTGVQMDDPRLQCTDDPTHKRLWSCCYGHLDNLANFLKTDKKYGFTSEDDVYIHKQLAERLPTIIAEFETMKLDVLLLGYMITEPVKDWWTGYHFMYPYDPHREYQYHAYPNHQWGIHLAMFSRDYAQRCVDHFGNNYAPKTLVDPTIAPFNPDWTLTKWTEKRALMYPMMAVEDGKGNYDHYGQRAFHQRNTEVNYIPDAFY